MASWKPPWRAQPAAPDGPAA